MPLAPVRRVLLTLASAAALLPAAAPAQRISVEAEDYRHVFEGGGSSIPLYLFNHYALPPAGQAEALDLIVRDLNLRYLQDYPEYRPDDPAQAAYWQRRLDYFLAAQAVDPDVEIVLVGNKFPADLMTTVQVDGQTLRALDTGRDSIYWDVARWYFDMLDYYRRGGVDVDLLNVVNEPDFDKRYYYGQDGRTEFAVARLFTETLDALRRLVDSAAVNTSGVVMPRIMGPSTIGPGGARAYATALKRDYPAAWANIDVFAYHQYVGGTSTDLIYIESAAEGRPIHVSEMHTNRGDDLPALGQLATNHRGVLSLARIFGAAVRRGANAWYYFLNVFPGEQRNPGLLRVDIGFERPVPYKHYYAYKQLTSTQPRDSRVVDLRLAGIRDEADVLAFRPEGADSVYLHYANFTSVSRRLTVDVLDAAGAALPVAGYTQLVTDGTRDEAEVGPGTFPADSSEFSFVAPPYSLSSLTVGLARASGLSPKPVVQQRGLRAWQTGDRLYVATEDAAALARVRLVDGAGRMVLDRPLAGDGGAVELDVAGLPAGAYVVVGEGRGLARSVGVVLR